MKKKIFLSYKWENEKIAKSLKNILESYDYLALIDSDKSFSGGDWRVEMMLALKNSDVLVAIYTEDALRSQYIPGEIGMARAYRDMGKNIIIIPLIISINVPPFLSDLNLIFINSFSVEDLTIAAGKINESILRQIAIRKRYPQIFISHRHKHESVVQALIDVISAAFIVSKEDIRCTSVPPYRLPIGGQTSEILRDELNNAKVVLGIISPDVNESQYTLFELGASWGKSANTFPLLVGGAQLKDVPGPLSEKHCISLSNQEDCWQLIDELKMMTTFQYQIDNDSNIRRALHSLVEICKENNSVQSKNTENNAYGADFTIISSYLKSKGHSMISFERLKELYPSFDEEYVMKIIKTYPEKIRIGVLKDKKRGIKIL